jgi:hypothetical protein
MGSWRRFRSLAMIHQIGDIVRRCDIRGRKRYRITHFANDGSGWVYAVPVGSGTVCFPSQFMIRKVN